MKRHAGLCIIAMGITSLFYACNRDMSSPQPVDADIYKAATLFLCNEANVRPEEVIADTSFKIEQDPDSTYTVGLLVRLKNVTNLKIPKSALQESYTLTLKYKGGDPKETKNWYIQDLEYDE